MRGNRVKQLREALRQANIMIGIGTSEGITLKRIKRNHRGSRKTFTKPATATGYFCCRPAAQHRKAAIAAKYERMVENDI